ncbi:MAG: sulfite exporter TauE/SafE family protein [Rhodospirillales bacterium]|nr:sulfite exporter TauE/SafE family protein [Rhodospirillales bacterium]
MGLFLAGVVKGATGLGYSSCALPFLVSALGLKPAMALILVPAMATNVTVAFSAGHFAETTRRFANLYIAMLPGIAVGVCLLVWIAQAVAVRTLGVVIILYALMTLARPQILMSGVAERMLQIPTGFANGVLTGLTGSQVMPLFPYMMSLNLEPNRMVQAINLAVSIASVFLAVGLFSAGIMTPELMGASVLAILPAIAGVELGSRIRTHIPASQFRSVVLYVLLATGFLLLVRS